MRVYELAKKIKVSSAELLKAAQALEIEATTAMSTLDSDDASRLQNSLKSSADDQRAAEARTASKAEKAVQIAQMSLQKERAVLEANRTRALEMDAKNKGKPLPVKPAAAPAATPAPVAQVEPVAEPAKVDAVATPAPAPAPTTAPAPAVVHAATPSTPEPAAAPKASEPLAEVPAASTEEKPAAPVYRTIQLPQKPAPAAVQQQDKSQEKRLPKKPGAPRYVDDEELEPEEELAAPFIGRINKSIAKDPPRVPRANVTKERGNGRELPDSRRPMPPQRGVQQGPQRAPFNQQGRAPFPNNRQPNSALRGPVSPAPAEAVTPDRLITLRGAVVVKELADMLGLRPNRLIADLMQLNILAAINQRVEIDVATKIAEKYGYKIEIERQKRSTERKPVLRSEDADDAIPDDNPDDMVPRPPVVTFLGHVDHGKTSLMDRIRNTRVASGEAGGITQHIGAYTVEINGRRITFLDTPGHAAFSAMRARGASLTDIAVIIIAADDGIMPQTREVIKQAQQAGVQIMVAINKCDLPTARPDRVRQMLQGEGLTPEEWGGDVICSEVSAVTGQGVDHLLEMILLQSDVLELVANPTRRADGYVVEAQLEQGLGPTATLLVTGGTLNVGDILLCGEYFGRIRGLIDDRGRRVKSAGPTTAVKCMGLSGVPEAGAQFRVMLNEKRARELSERAAEERKQSALVNAKATSLDALMTQMKDSQKRELAVIVKADTQGSSEAIVEALKNIKSDKVTLNIVSESIGNISATDVNKAAAGKAVVLGFSVSCESGVQQLARHVGVRVNTFRIIYELIDFIKQRMLDLLSPEFKEVVRGHAEIRAAFDIGKMGRVAGCQMLDGVLRADARYRVFRKKEKVWDGKLTSLKHFQNEVSEVSGSQECGIFFNGFEEFQVGDTIECYALEELPRTL